MSGREGRLQAAGLAQQSLKLLPSFGDMEPNRNEPFPCLLWQRLHYPSTAFGTLWGGIMTHGKSNPDQSKQSLEAMELLPIYLGKLRSRNVLAAKLEDITKKFAKHARTILFSQGNRGLVHFLIRMCLT